MARKPKNFQWVGYTEEQLSLLDFLDFVGNNGWARNSQTDAMMTKLLGQLADEGVPLSRMIEAMRAIGYRKDSLHMLERWESKRTSGKFGR